MQRPNDKHIAAQLTRRRFLKSTAGLAGSAICNPAFAKGNEQTLHLPAGMPLSRVIQVQSPYAVKGPNVHRALFSEMLAKALTSLTGRSTIRNAWHAILKPDDVIGLKFNRSGQRIIATTSTVADVLITSLIDAGWRRNQIVCVEAPAETSKRLGTTTPRAGYSSILTDFDSGEDYFASVLDQITALINVPFLKVHNICRMTCALKNLSHGLIKHPARYHSNGCSPYIADIVAAKPIRSKLRLCLADALRVAYDGGPEPTADTLHDHGTLLASFDPVALDTTGLAILNDIRRQYGYEPIARSAADIPFLAAAHNRALGIAVWHGIELIRLKP